MREFEGVLYLEYEDALDVYATIFDCTPREAQDQLRNRDGLESALARPTHYLAYYGADLALQTAVLAHGIAEGQHFVEGNKRTAYFAAITFLGANGFSLDAPQMEVQNWIEELSQGLNEEELASRIRPVLVEDS